MRKGGDDPLLLSTAAAPVHIPTSSVGGFPSLPGGL